MIEITVESSYERFEHFTTIIMCGGFNEASEKLYVTGKLYEEFSPKYSFSAEDAHHIETIIYIIPKFLPGSKNSPIEDFPPFEARITITHDTKEVYNTLHTINAWGGSVVKLDKDI